MTIFTVYAFDNINTNPSNVNNVNVVENEIILEDDEILATDSDNEDSNDEESDSVENNEVDNSEPVEDISA